MKKWAFYIFFGILAASLLTPLWVFSELQFPFITGKAFFLRIAVEAALPFYIYLLLVDKSLRPKLKNPLNAAVLAFLLINLLTSLAGVSVARSLWGNFERMGGAYYLAHLAMLYFYVQAVAQAGGKYLKWFLDLFIISSVFLTLNAFSGWFGGPVLALDPSLPERASSTFGNPIFFASYLIFPMFLSAYLALAVEKKWPRAWYWLAAALMLGGIYISGTRGAAAGLAVGLFIAAVAYLLLVREPKVRKYGLAAVIGVIALAIGFFAAGRNAPEKTVFYRFSHFNDENTQSRLLQWKIAFKGFTDRPLLGTGPENYYVVFDEHFDPQLYKYDRSWFDKPHNYLLEILTGTGIFGLGAYLAIFALSAFALWRAYKAELLSLAEASVLFAALVAYQVQNLTVFDTVSASMAFYLFTGLAAYLWQAGDRGEENVKEFHKLWQAAVGGVLLIAAIPIIYVSNVESIKAAKYTNFGTAYVQLNPEKSSEYFKSALAIKHNLDPRETANRYSDAAAKFLTQGSSNLNPETLVGILDDATAQQEKLTLKVKNDPLLWMRLVIDKMNQAAAHGESLDAVQPYMDQMIQLSPKRLELWQLNLQLYGMKQDWAGAVKIAKVMAEIDLSDSELRWQLAMAYKLNGQESEAVRTGDEAVAMGMEFAKLRQFAWYVEYYLNKKDYQKAAPLLEKAIALEPGEAGLYLDLARAYAGLGNPEKARLLAQQAAALNPGLRAQAEQLLKTLK